MHDPILSPGIVQLRDHHLANTRRHPELVGVAEAIRHDDTVVLIDTIRRFQAGDPNAGIATLYGLAWRITGVAVGTHRGSREIEQIVDDHLSIAWLVLRDLDPDLTHLINRFQSRLWRRYARAHAREVEHPHVVVVPLLEHDTEEPSASRGGHADPTAARAMQRVEVRNLADRVRQQIADGVINPAAWQAMTDCRVAGATSQSTCGGLSPSGMRSAIARTASLLRPSVILDDAA